VPIGYADYLLSLRLLTRADGVLLPARFSQPNPGPAAILWDELDPTFFQPAHESSQGHSIRIDRARP
jgi:hypothetical protein